MSIAENIERVEAAIAHACAVSGRDRKDVTLIAVTKTVDAGSIQTAVDCGICDLGENRVQELMQKTDALSGVTWHLIGHLQTNKVRHVVGTAALIHSVDSERLLAAVDAAAKNAGVIQKILLEVNLSGEKSKFGLTTAQLQDIITKLGDYPHISCIGLMTMAPRSEDPEDARPIFRAARALFEACRDKQPLFSVLSMGMSGDFAVAVEEGATHVRVGSAIFRA